MATSGEPPLKKPIIDFEQCIKCQGEKWDSAKKLEQLTSPTRESYAKFIETIERRAGYGNPDFVILHQRMRSLSADILEENQAVWHKTCYSAVTHKLHTERDQKRYEKALSNKNPDALSYEKKGGRPTSSNTTDIINSDDEDSTARNRTLTRSHVTSFKRELCFYCQTVKHDNKHARAGTTPEQVHLCRSADIGTSIKAIVDASDNVVWKLNMADLLADGDFHARDIRYHTSCHLTHWRHHKHEPKTRTNSPDEDTIAFISAEIEFVAELQERLDNGEIITITEVTTLYTNMMFDHGIQDKTISRQLLLTKLEHSISNFTITGAKGRKPAVIHSNEAGRSAIDQAIVDRDVKGDMTALYRCSKIIRQAVLQTREESPWSFEGSLVGCSEAGVPVQLITFMRWILQGAKAATTETRTEVLHKSCLILSQSITQACKTSRQITLVPVSSDSMFRTMFENPYSVGLSLYMYHNFRSQTAVSLLNKYGAGISFDRVTTICNNIAHAVAQNITEYGVYVPPGLMRNKAIRASLDNVDKKVDTPDGKGSFHGTALAVYQRSGRGETVAKPVQITSKRQVSEVLHDVPPTVITMVKCTIEGNPKPKTSPHYANYKMGVYDDEYRRSQIHDIGWMVGRFSNRPRIHKPGSQASTIDNDGREESPTGKQNDMQQLPVWSAYNSLTHEPLPTDDPIVVDQAYGLPIINAPAHEWPTLVTALDQLSRLNELVSGPDSKLVATMDMDLYKRALKLEYLDPQYKNKWVLCPGAFHTVLCALRCLGRTIEGSGLDDAWQEADMYSSITVTQIINGNHHNRALQAHQITLQTLFDLWLSAFLDDHPQVCESLCSAALEFTEACKVKHDVRTAHQTFAMKLESMNLEKQLMDYDHTHEKNPMYKWARMYMKQIMVLLQFQRATREGNWFLYLSTLEKLCVYFFAYNRLDYAQNIPEYIARMHDMQTTNPEIWQEFVNGDFTVNTSNTVPFTRIAVDQAMEHLIKTAKGQGGISGITSNPTTLLKFCLTGPELARIAAEGERLTAVTNSETHHQQHHCLSQAKVRKQEQSITKLKKVLVPCNLFSGSSACESDSAEDSTTEHMHKLLSNEIIPDNIKDSILSTETMGMDAYTRFVQGRLTGDGNLWAKMTKVKLLSWTASAKELKLKAGSEVMTVKASSSLFARMLIVARSSRDNVDLEEVIGIHEFANTHRALMQPNGSVHQTTDKSMVIHMLEDLQPDDHTSTSATTQITDEEIGVCLIVDGMAVVQELMAVKNVRTCMELGTAYVNLIDSKGRGYDQVRVIFDNYTKVSSMKEGTRERRRGKVKAIRSYIVDDSTAIKDKSLFLSSNATKDSLTLYLAQQLINQSSIQKLVTVTRSSVMKNSDVYVSTGVSTQEEADTIMVLHAVEVAGSGLDVHIYSQDTDVLLLALRRVPLLGKQPALIMGTSENRRKVWLKPIYDALGADKASALINWHALTGCDTTGHIQGTSKKGCFRAFLNSTPAVITALIGLGEGAEPSDEVVKGCAEFICSILCPKGLHFSRAKDIRWYMFKRLRLDQGVEKLPPTEGAWLEHIRRAHLQANVWSQDLVLNPITLDPVMLGWQLEDGKLCPVLSREAPAPESVVQLIRCNCGSTNVNSTKKCSGRCSCKKLNIVCTELCHCSGDDKCQNTVPVIIGEDIQDDDWNLLDSIV